MDKIHPSERMNGWEGRLEVIKTRKKDWCVKKRKDKKEKKLMIIHRIFPY
jgi:hypothetical protein